MNTFRIHLSNHHILALICSDWNLYFALKAKNVFFGLILHLLATRILQRSYSSFVSLWSESMDFKMIVIILSIHMDLMGVWMNTCLYSIDYSLYLLLATCYYLHILWYSTHFNLRLNVCCGNMPSLSALLYSNGCLLRQQAAQLLLRWYRFNRFIAHFAHILHISDLVKRCSQANRLDFMRKIKLRNSLISRCEIKWIKRIALNWLTLGIRNMNESERKKIYTHTQTQTTNLMYDFFLQVITTDPALMNLIIPVASGMSWNENLLLRYN